MSADYSLNWSSAERVFFTQRSKNVSIDFLDIDNNMKVLEIGCGSGGVIRRIASTHPSVSITGIDTSNSIIEEARVLAFRDNLNNVQFITADAHKLPFNNPEFDLCFFQTVLMHLKNPLVALKNMVRVIKEGGRLIAVSEGDWGNVLTHPTCEALEKMIAFYLNMIFKSGGDPFIGKKLEKLFKELALNQIDVFENNDSRRIVTGKDFLSSGYLNIAASFQNDHNFLFNQYDKNKLLHQINAWCNKKESYIIMPATYGAIGRK